MKYEIRQIYLKPTMKSGNILVAFAKTAATVSITSYATTTSVKASSDNEVIM